MVKNVAMPDLEFTRADYDRLPEDLRVELIDGELLKMAPPTVLHQKVLMRVLKALTEAAGWDRVLAGPTGFAIDDRSALIPDAVALEAPPPAEAKELSTALIVVEVLSPSTAARDRKVKAKKYLEAGVGELWLVDPKSRTIEVRRKRGCRTFKGDDAAVSRNVAGFRLVPAELFKI